MTYSTSVYGCTIKHDITFSAISWLCVKCLLSHVPGYPWGILRTHTTPVVCDGTQVCGKTPQPLTLGGSSLASLCTYWALEIVSVAWQLNCSMVLVGMNCLQLCKCLSECTYYNFSVHLLSRYGCLSVCVVYVCGGGCVHFRIVFVSDLSCNELACGNSEKYHKG